MESAKYDSITLSSKDELEIKSWVSLLQPKCINSEPKKVFGVDIKELVSRPDQFPIPSVLVKTTTEIRARALDEEGIFRINGSVLDIEKYRDRFDDGEDVDLTRESIHTICGLLKLYLRELPEPVLTFNLYGKFVTTYSDFKMRNPGEVSLYERSLLVSQLTEALSILPEPNFRVFDFLAKFLSEVEKHSAQNLMNLGNLSRVFGPTLLRTRTSEENLIAEIAELVTDSAVIPEVTAFLIRYQDEMFPRVEEYRQKALLAAELEREKEEAERAKRLELSLKAKEELSTSGDAAIQVKPPSPRAETASPTETQVASPVKVPPALTELKSITTPTTTTTKGGKASMSEGDLRAILDAESSDEEEKRNKEAEGTSPKTTTTKATKKRGESQPEKAAEQQIVTTETEKEGGGKTKRRSASETPPVEPETKAEEPASPRKGKKGKGGKPTDNKKQDLRKTRPLSKSGSLGILPVNTKKADATSPSKLARTDKEIEKSPDKDLKKKKREEAEREKKERKEKEERERKEKREREERERKEEKERREKEEREKKEKIKEERERKEKEKRDKEREEKERKEKEKRDKKLLKTSNKGGLDSPKGVKVGLTQSGGKLRKKPKDKNAEDKDKQPTDEKDSSVEKEKEKQQQQQQQPKEEGEKDGEKESCKELKPRAMTLEQIEEDMSHLVGSVNIKRLKKALFDDVVFVESELRKLAKKILTEESNDKLASLVQFEAKVVHPQIERLQEVLKIPSYNSSEDLSAPPTGSVIADPKRRMKHAAAMSLVVDIRIFQTIKQLVNMLNDPKRLLALSSVLAEVLNTFKYLAIDV